MATEKDVNAIQQQDYFPLHEAAQNGALEMIKLLPAHGANTNARIASDATPLETALKAGHADAAELIQKHGK